MKTRDIVGDQYRYYNDPLDSRTPLMVQIPPFFTATIAAHVPTLLAMAISPGVAAMVAIGSGIGFTLKVNAIVGARAFTHLIFALIGAYSYQKGKSYNKILLFTAPIHGLFEALIVLPFGWDLKKALLACGLGTIVHHLIDSVIAAVVYQALLKASFLKRPSSSV